MKIKAFIKKNVVMIVAFFAAFLTTFILPPLARVAVRKGRKTMLVA